MKTLEDIMRDVRPDKLQTWLMNDAEFALVHRATRNFVPLVKALIAAQRLDYLHEQIMENAINQALADEP